MNLKNYIKEYFKDLEFVEENHKYYVNGEEYISVSEALKKFYEPFDDSIAISVARRMGKSVREVLDEWEKIRIEAAEKGTKIHQFAEDYALGKDLCIDVKNPLFNRLIQVKRFIDDAQFKIAFTELKMYHKKYKFAGTADLILAEEDGTFSIYDYKTNKNLIKRNNPALRHPFNDYTDTPLNRYQLQLSHYKMMLEQVEGVKVSSLKLVHITDFMYKIYEVQDMSNKLIEYYETVGNNTESSVFIF